jgi:hypothetical protein
VIVFDDAYFNDYVVVTARLATALRLATRDGRATRFRVADALAEELGIESEPAGPQAFRVLLALVPELDDALARDPDEWAADGSRAEQMVRTATEGFDVAELVAALGQLGWGRLQPPLTVGDVGDLKESLAWVLARELSPRLRRMLDQWRKRGAWTADPRRRPPRDAP